MVQSNDLVRESSLAGLMDIVGRRVLMVRWLKVKVRAKKLVGARILFDPMAMMLVQV